MRCVLGSIYFYQIGVSMVGDYKKIRYYNWKEEPALTLFMFRTDLLGPVIILESQAAKELSYTDSILWSGRSYYEPGARFCNDWWYRYEG